MVELAGVALFVVILVWLLRPRTKPAPEPWEDREPVDQAELEAAEREVRDMDPGESDVEV